TDEIRTLDSLGKSISVDYRLTRCPWKANVRIIFSGYIYVSAPFITLYPFYNTYYPYGRTHYKVPQFLETLELPQSGLAIRQRIKSDRAATRKMLRRRWRRQ